jgi:hypothetical protein
LMEKLQLRLDLKRLKSNLIVKFNNHIYKQ